MAKQPLSGEERLREDDASEEEVDETEDDSAEGSDDSHEPENKEGADDAGGEDAGDEEGEEEGGDDKSDEDEDAEPPVRRSALQHIIARKNRTIEKLRDKKADGEEKDADAEEQDGGDSEQAQSTLEMVQREVRRQTEPLKKVVVSQADELELRELFEIHPEARKQEKQIRKYMEHPAYADVPLSFIWSGISKGTQQANAKRKAVADKAAKLGGPVGRQGTRQGARPKSDWDNLPDDDNKIEEIAERAKRGEYLEQ